MRKPHSRVRFFFMRAVRKLKFNEKEYKYIIDFIGRH